MSGANDKQVTCRFTTKLPEIYRVPATEIAVPANLTRYGLSQVINHLLALDTPVPFDFLVNGELVRLSLGKLLLSQQLSTERVLEVDYILLVTPPEEKQQLPHDDWIGAISGSRPNVILSGCYDGLLRVWNDHAELLGSTAIHKGPVSALEGVPKSTTALLLSGGKLDHAARLLQIDPASNAATAVGVYRGHRGSILGLAAAPSGETFVSASQDKTLRIWPTGDSVSAEAVEKGHITSPGAKKKQKLQNGAAVVAGGIEIESSAELSGHSDAATAVAWSENGCIYSGSMDHSVKKWDAETGTNVDTFNDRKAVSCIGVPSSGRDLVALAGASKALHLWDPRQRHAGGAGVKTFTSHSSHIHALAWHPASEHHLVTASLDKTLRLWDLRSSIPLHALEGHTDQVLCSAWWGPQKIVSGSADKTVRVFEVPLRL